MDNRTELKAEIKKKFGSMSHFARLADPDNAAEFRQRLQIMFAVVTPDAEFMANVVNFLANTGPIVIGGPIDPEKLELLKTKINEAGGVAKFCEENTLFPQFSVYQILSGKRKRMTEMVQDLFDHFQL
jgi:hypothetical protein